MCRFCEKRIEEKSQYFPYCSANCKRAYEWDLYPSFSSYSVRTIVFFVILTIIGLIYFFITQTFFQTFFLLSVERRLHYNYLLVVSLLSVITAFFFFMKSILEIRASMKWPNVEGKVVVSNLRWIPGESAKPEIVYSYNVAGRDYQAKKIVIGQLWGNTGKAWANHKVIRYPKGSIVTVYYHPKAPKKALLEPGLNSQFLTLWFRVVPIILVIIVPLFSLLPFFF